MLVTSPRCRTSLALRPLLRHPIARAGALLLGLLLAGTTAALAWPRTTPLPARLPSGPEPVAVAVDAADGLVYVASRSADAVVLLDRRNGGIRGSLTLTGEPAALALDTAHHRLYVADNDATLTVMDTRISTTIARLPIGSHRLANAELPLQIAADPSTGRAYVPDTDRDAVCVVALEQTPLSSFRVGHHPVAVAVDPVRGRLYTANAGDGSVSVLASQSGTRLASVAIGGVPVALAVDAGTGRVYVADYLGARVAVLDATLRVIDRVPVAPFPTAIAVNPTTHRVYIAHDDTNAVTVLTGQRPAVLGELSVGQRPDAIAVDPALARVYVANWAGDDLAVLRDQPGAEPVILVKGTLPPLPEDCAGRCDEAIHTHG